MEDKSDNIHSQLVELYVTLKYTPEGAKQIADAVMWWNAKTVSMPMGVVMQAIRTMPESAMLVYGKLACDLHIMFADDTRPEAIFANKMFEQARKISSMNDADLWSIVYQQTTDAINTGHDLSQHYPEVVSGDVFMAMQKPNNTTVH